MVYLRRVFEVPPGVVDEVVAALGEAGTLGIEEVAAADGAQRLIAYFSGGAPVDLALPAGATLVEEVTLSAVDWLASFRELAQPLEIGERFVIDPREPEEPAPRVAPGRMLLRVPARSAFGTGSHASTRLALRLLERQALAGRSVLDVGTGSGVLALAALALGARRAHGFDLDVAAALLAGQHAWLNGLLATVWAGGSESLAPRARYDLVVVNALPHEVLPEAGRIATAVADGGRLVVSGVLASEGEPTLRAWAAHGLAPVDTLAEEEWVAWALCRASPEPRE